MFVVSRNSVQLIVGCLLFFFSILNCGNAIAKSKIDFKIYIDDINLPSPPQNLRIIEVRSVLYGNLFEQLGDQDPDIREKAAKEIFKYAKNLASYVKDLAQALQNKDVFVRRCVAGALSKLGTDAYPATPVLIQALKDPDFYVRLNAIAAIGNIGPSASFTVSHLIKLLKDDNVKIRAYAAGSLGKIGSDDSSAVSDLIKLLDDEHFIVREYTIKALGLIGPDARGAIPMLIKLFKKGRKYDQELVAETLSKIATTLHDNDVIDALPKLEEAEIALRDSRYSGVKKYAETICRARKYLKLKKEMTSQVGTEERKVIFENEIPKEFVNEQNLIVNGARLSISKVDIAKQVIYLSGDNDFLKRGLNYIESKVKCLSFWFEERKLKKFKAPYERSYAIIAAINDYGRVRDAKGRGSTGYRNLDFMVEEAKELGNTLEKLGFPRENIFEFYDKDATSSKLNRMLDEFWLGGKYEDADRLFFYFGGHGDVRHKSGYLVTYDYDQERPTLSSILMNDLTSRHFQNFKVHHVLVALDSCSSGLALPRFLTSEYDDERLKAFRTLSIIEGETEKRARNILVAGTENQKALWENGGIFTKALNAGLQGDADYNDDRVIQFDELFMFVKNHVRAKAKQTGVDQVPNCFQYDRLGGGNVLFLRH